MKTGLYLLIALRIILLFSFGFLFSFVWEAQGIHEFMGDELQESRVDEYKHASKIYDPKERNMYEQSLMIGHDHMCSYGRHYHWGVRHHWLTWCTIFLLLLSIADFIIAIVNAVKKAYPNTANK